MIGHFLSSREIWFLRKGDATRARILEEAGRQAAARGLTGVSLNDVAEGAGLSKSGLFKHFESKEAMQQAVLERVLGSFAAFVWEPVRDLPKGRARLEAIFERWLDWAEVENAAGGCLIIAAGVELDDQPGPLRDYLQAQQRLWMETLARQFQALREPPLPPAEAELAAFQMKSFILGHNEARRLLEDAGARQAARASFAALLDRTARS